MKKYAEIWFGLIVLAICALLMFISVLDAKKRENHTAIQSVYVTNDGAVYFDLGGHSFYSSPGAGADNAVYHSHGCECGWKKTLEALHNSTH